MKKQFISFTLLLVLLSCKNTKNTFENHSDKNEMVEVIPKGKTLDVVIQGKPSRLKAYKIAKKEVSSSLWKEVVDWAIKKGYKFTQNGFISNELPITNITWRDAIVWCNSYSEKDNLAPCYYATKKEVIKDATNASMCDLCRLDIEKTGYRLPKEAEWELAARGGMPEGEDWELIYAGGNNLNELGWYKENSNGMLHASGEKKPNSLGLYDMSGNVWEWCYDWYNKEETARVNRGGGAISYLEFCKVSENGSNFPDTKDPYLGFRLARSIR
jgi:hypothetical protein